LSLDKLATRKILLNAIDGLTDNQASEKLEHLIVPVMERIGSGWEKGDIALSQVYMSGRICEALMNELVSNNASSQKNILKTAIVVLEDRHMLGQRIVYSVLKASGYDLMNYGSMSVDDLADRIKSDGVEVILISALMFPSALRIKDLKSKLTGTNVKIIVGGAPFRFDKKLWEEVGADAMGGNAADAVKILDGLNQERIGIK